MWPTALGMVGLHTRAQCVWAASTLVMSCRWRQGGGGEDDWLCITSAVFFLTSSPTCLSQVSQPSPPSLSTHLGTVPTFWLGVTAGASCCMVSQAFSILDDSFVSQGQECTGRYELYACGEAAAVSVWTMPVVRLLLSVYELCLWWGCCCQCMNYACGEAAAVSVWLCLWWGCCCQCMNYACGEAAAVSVWTMPVVRLLLSVYELCLWWGLLLSVYELCLWWGCCCQCMNYACGEAAAVSV